MRRVLLLFIASCGRLSFDDQPSVSDGGVADGGPRDASPKATYYLMSSSSPNSELFTVELTTGQLSLVGTIPPGFGTIGGLAYWDANTIYGAQTGSLVRITLSPFGAVKVADTAGTWSALERDGASLFGINQDTDSFARFDPASPGGVLMGGPMGFDAEGGDLARADGNWYHFANTTTQLYKMSTSPTPVGSPATGAPFVSGMVADDSANLWIHSSSANALYKLDKGTGQIGPGIPLCLVCPTPYDVQSGDMTRTP